MEFYSIYIYELYTLVFYILLRLVKSSLLNKMCQVP